MSSSYKSSFYKDDAVKAGDTVAGKSGVFSARSLEPDSEVKGFQLIILGSFDLSRKSKNFSEVMFYAPIILVNEENRLKLFERMSKELKIDDSNLASLLWDIYDEGLLKGVRGIDHDTLDLYQIKFNKGNAV